METPCPDWREKPPEWKASGKRIKRGLYRSADGTLINADLNGSVSRISGALALRASMDRQLIINNISRIMLNGYDANTLTTL